ncbi:maltose acetyltransferase domain-containing protein, partial [Shewanella vesiculosa]
MSKSCIKELHQVSEKSKMLAGELYDPSNKELVEMRLSAR